MRQRPSASVLLKFVNACVNFVKETNFEKIAWRKKYQLPVFSQMFPNLAVFRLGLILQKNLKVK